MKENRKDPRVEITLTARWQGSASNQNVRISDLSKAGCYLDTIAQVALGETLALEILLANDEWFQVEGVVAHHTPRLGFGVRFVDLDVAQHKQICSLLGLETACSSESAETANAVEMFMSFEVDDLASLIIM
jgi:PilZ domain